MEEVIVKRVSNIVFLFLEICGSICIGLAKFTHLIETYRTASKRTLMLFKLESYYDKGYDRLVGTIIVYENIALRG